MPQIKDAGGKTQVLSQVSNITTVSGAAKKQPISESQGVLIIGNLASTGANFQRAFPNSTVAAQWLQSGDGADVVVSRIEPITFTS